MPCCGRVGALGIAANFLKINSPINYNSARRAKAFAQYPIATITINLHNLNDRFARSLNGIGFELCRRRRIGTHSNSLGARMQIQMLHKYMNYDVHESLRVSQMIPCCATGIHWSGRCREIRSTWIGHPKNLIFPQNFEKIYFQIFKNGRHRDGHSYKPQELLHKNVFSTRD